MINLPLLTSKLRPCLIREYRHEDADACVDIYRSNMPVSLPPEVLPHFEQFLQTGTSYLLVVESDGRITGTGSLSIQGDSDSAGLAYGLIHPDSQRQGLGSSLLAARLSLVDSESWPTKVVLEASPLAGDFYAQFGFELYLTHKGYHLRKEGDESTRQVPYGRWYLNLTQDDVEALRTALQEHGVKIQLDDHSLFAAEEPSEAEATP